MLAQGAAGEALPLQCMRRPLVRGPALLRGLHELQGPTTQGVARPFTAGSNWPPALHIITIEHVHARLLPSRRGGGELTSWIVVPLCFALGRSLVKHSLEGYMPATKPSKPSNKEAAAAVEARPKRNTAQASGRGRRSKRKDRCAPRSAAKQWHWRACACAHTQPPRQLQFGYASLTWTCMLRVSLAAGRPSQAVLPPTHLSRRRTRCRKAASCSCMAGAHTPAGASVSASG